MSPDRMLHLGWKHAFGPLLVVMNCHFLVSWMDVDCLTTAQLEAYGSPFPAYTLCYFFWVISIAVMLIGNKKV